MYEPVALSLAFLPPSPHAQGCTPERERVLADRSTRVQRKLCAHNPVVNFGPGSDDPASHPSKPLPIYEPGFQNVSAVRLEGTWAPKSNCFMIYHAIPVHMQCEEAMGRRGDPKSKIQ